MIAVSGDEWDSLAEAVRWIGRHAGIDAPAYPRMETLAHVADCIDQRQAAAPPITNLSPVGIEGVRCDDVRPGSPNARNDAGDRRDREATERDRDADSRDRNADQRDTRSLLRGEPDDERAWAFTGHRLGADDRAKAAHDRQSAQADRAAAAQDRKAACEENPND